ncbi:extracellular solute-binding protein [Mesorhizobium sp. AA22]|uniref:extracellular solute-binding protein n=2 Tax=Mesorhizobium TaxID=68287 RepID=UPI0009F6775B|nr:extracellular solute-binding protein [Mesorhizobium sp. AA22]PBB51877.1 hypothetical protein CK223_32685 [Mesorhizobium loti]QIA25540.1 extracellular solute-binding protein [Mesorhizobium sp. AA22]
MFSRLATTAILGFALMSGAASAAPITLQVDATPSIFAEMFQNLVKAFEVENPDVKINLDLTQRDQTDAIQSVLRKGLVGQLPDISFQSFNYLKLLDDQGYVAPVGDFIKSDTSWSTDFSPSVTQATTINGKVLGLSVAFSFPVVFYNKELVAEAQNGDGTLPGTWDGILGVAKSIQQQHPDVLGAYTRYNSFVGQGFILSQGAEVGNAAGTEVAFANDAGRHAFDLFRQFGEAGQAKVDMTDEQARQAFSGGKIAILVDSSSSLESFQRAAQGHFEIGTIRFPFANDSGKIPTAGIAVLLHARDDDRAKAAWRFMRFVSSPKAQVIVGKSTGYVPANNVAVETADLLGQYYKDRPAMSAALDSIAYAAPWYAFNGTGAARIDQLFLDSARQVVTLRQSPADAVADLQNKIPGMVGE